MSCTNFDRFIKIDTFGSGKWGRYRHIIHNLTEIQNGYEQNKYDNSANKTAFRNS
jgi:hypothetical protein